MPTCQAFQMCSQAKPPSRLRIVMSRRVRLRLELANPAVATQFGVLARDGSRRYIHSFSGQILGQMTRGQLHDGRSAVVAVREDVATMVLFKDSGEVERFAVELTPGIINVIRY